MVASFAPLSESHFPMVPLPCNAFVPAMSSSPFFSLVTLSTVKASPAATVTFWSSLHKFEDRPAHQKAKLVETNGKYIQLEEFATTLNKCLI